MQPAELQVGQVRQLRQRLRHDAFRQAGEPRLAPLACAAAPAVERLPQERAQWRQEAAGGQAGRQQQAVAAASRQAAREGCMLWLCAGRLGRRMCPYQEAQL